MYKTVLPKIKPIYYCSGKLQIFHCHGWLLVHWFTIIFGPIMFWLVIANMIDALGQGSWLILHWSHTALSNKDMALHECFFGWLFSKDVMGFVEFQDLKTGGDSTNLSHVLKVKKVRNRLTNLSKFIQLVRSRMTIRFLFSNSLILHSKMLYHLP